MEGLEAALGRKEQKNRHRKVTGEVEAQLCLIVCSEPPEGMSRWTMHAIADELIQKTRVPCEPGQPEKVDSEYVRNGVADVFMICEPLTGKRETVVTQTRTALDFAHVLQYTSDTLYPRAEKIVLVTDNLNTHSPASLYKAFTPEEARRLTERFEWHYTPRHGSWLDMAEIEIGILCRQALARPLPDFDSFQKQVRAWTIHRNSLCAKVNWQFTTSDARLKLARLYPSFL